MPTLSPAQAVAQLTATQEKLFAIVEGPATGDGSTVATESNPNQPTVAKVLAELPGVLTTSVQVLTSERVSIEDFKDADGNQLADPSGATSSAAALTAAFAAHNHVIIPPNKQFNFGDDYTIAGDDKTLECWGNGRILGNPGKTIFNISGRDCHLINPRVTGGGGLNTIFANFGNRGRVTNGHLDGDFQFHFYFGPGADDSEICGTLIDQSACVSTYAAIKLDRAAGVKVDYLTVRDFMGFGMQSVSEGAGATSGGRFLGNKIIGQKYVDPAHPTGIVATGAQTVFVFNFPKTAMIRNALYVNGVPTPIDGAAVSSAHNTSYSQWTITFDAGRTAGDIIQLYVWRAFESFNINSGAADLLMENNYCYSCGDSNFVFCNDRATAAATRCTMIGNTGRGAAYAGIAETVPITGNAYIDNELSDFGIARLSGGDDVYSSGIVLGAGSGSAAIRGGNILRNTSGNAKYGIAMNGIAVPTDNFTPSYDIEVPVMIGTFTKKLYLQQNDASNLSAGIRLKGLPTSPLGERPALASSWTGAPSPTGNFSYGITGSGWTRETSDTSNGTACIRTIDGSYVDIGLLGSHRFNRGHLTIFLDGKKVSGTPSVALFLQVGADFPLLTLPITKSDDWYTYTIELPIFGATRVYALRIGGSGVALIDDIDFLFQPYPV